MKKNKESYKFVLGMLLARVLGKSYFISELARLVVRVFDNDLNLDMYKNGEFSLLKSLIKILDKDSNIVDVGSNVGEYSLKAFELSFMGKVHLVDPLQRNLDISNNKLLNFGYDRFTLNKFALSNQISSEKFYTNNDHDLSGHDSLHDMKQIGGKESITTIEVDVTTFDNLVEEKKINKVHFMKIDVEGNELSVLEGSRNAFKNKLIDYVQFEYGNAALAARTNLYDFIVFFNQYKYTLYFIKPNGLEKINYDQYLEKRYNIINILAVPTDMIKDISDLVI